MLESKANTILELVNGTYQGSFFNNTRNGTGIFFWDNGMMYIGAWNNDKIEGKGLFFFPNGSLYFGEYKNNSLQNEGFYKNPDQNVLALINWDSNKTAYYFDKNKKIAKFKSSNSDNKAQRIILDESEFFKIVEDSEYDERKISLSYILQEISTSQTKNPLKYMKYSNGLEYIGFLNQGKAHGLGVFFENKKILCLGNFKDGLMDKNGRAFCGSEIYDGNFERGTFYGYGVYESLKEKVYLHGYFEENICKKVIKVDGGDTQNILKSLKCNSHKNSEKFIEDSLDLNIYEEIKKIIDYFENPQPQTISLALEKAQSAQNSLGKFEFSVKPDTFKKIFENSKSGSETSNKFNHYYLNYFNQKDIEIQSKSNINSTKTKTIYEEAQEELIENIKKAKHISKLTHIPIKFSEIDYESTETKINSKPIEKNAPKTTTKVSRDKTPEKTFKANLNTSSNKTKKQISQDLSTTKHKVNKTPNKQNKKIPALKNVNPDKGIINFTEESSSELKAPNLLQTILKTPTKTEINSKTKKSLNQEDSGIKIIARNSEAKENTNSMKSSKILSYKQIPSGNFLAKPAFENESSFVPLNTKGLNSYLLQEMQEKNKWNEETTIAHLKKPQLHPQDLDQIKDQEKDLMENLALQASHKLEDLINEPNKSIFMKASSKNYNLKPTTDNFIDENINIDLNVSETLSLPNIENDPNENQRLIINNSQRMSKKMMTSEENDADIADFKEISQNTDDNKSSQNKIKESKPTSILQENINNQNIERKETGEENNNNFIDLSKKEINENFMNDAQESDAKKNPKSHYKGGIIASLKKDHEKISRLFSFDNKYNEVETPKLLVGKSKMANQTEFHPKSAFEIKEKASDFKKIPFTEKSKTDATNFQINQNQTIKKNATENEIDMSAVKMDSSENLTSPANFHESLKEKKKNSLDLL